MQIGIIPHLKYPIAEPFARGLEMHTHLLARSLRNRGHEVLGNGDQYGGHGGTTNIAFFKEHHAYLSLMTELRHRRFDLIHNNSLLYAGDDGRQFGRTDGDHIAHAPDSIEFA